MPKPTRRERRRLAEQGKLAPRRPAPRAAERPTAERVEHPAATEPRERERVAPRKPTPAPPEEPAVMSDAHEYAYVKSDLVRIMVLAGTLIGIMVALKFVLPP